MLTSQLPLTLEQLRVSTDYQRMIFPIHLYVHAAIKKAPTNIADSSAITNATVITSLRLIFISVPPNKLLSYIRECF